MASLAKHLSFVAFAALTASATLVNTAHASDHADTPAIAANPSVDLTDVYLFESPTNANNVVLAMNIHPLLKLPELGLAAFDPNVLYQFKIDTNGDGVEDEVIQVQFDTNKITQRASIAGPMRPSTIGSFNIKEQTSGASGQLNQVFSPRPGVSVFTGIRADPFFFDLEQFFNIFPDRATPLTGVNVPNPNTPHELSFRPRGQAVDFLSNGRYNVLSVVIEMPKSMIMPKTGSQHRVIGLWCTTSVPSGDRYKQMDRLARPAINEVFATVANNRHKTNDEDSPSNDQFQLKKDMESFLTFPAGRSRAIKDVLEAVLIPDVLKADLDGSGSAYLGYETGGATGGTFGGRKLTDDVIDISLGAIFGNTVPALGLAPDDHAEIPALTTDNVGPEHKQFLPWFPYLGFPTP